MAVRILIVTRHEADPAERGQDKLGDHGFDQEDQARAGQGRQREIKVTEVVAGGDLAVSSDMLFSRDPLPCLAWLALREDAPLEASVNMWTRRLRPGALKVSAQKFDGAGGVRPSP